MYVRTMGWQLNKLFRACGWRVIADISGSGFCRWRSASTLQGKTLNNYLGYLSCFCNWLISSGRASVNPFGSPEAVDLRRRRRYRRAFTREELSRLVKASGDRSLVYVIAAWTGLRRNELAHLRWEDVQLSETAPRLIVRAEHSKHAKTMVLPLHPQAAVAFRELSRGRSGDLVFGSRGIPSCDMLREDLARAGIPFLDADGRRLDFHAFRGTLATFCAQAGLPVASTQSIMRHSDIRMTNQHYTDVGQLNTAASFAGVVGIPGFNPEFCHQSMPVSGHLPSSPVASGTIPNDAETCSSGGVCRDLASIDAVGHEGSKTAPARART